MDSLEGGLVCGRPAGLRPGAGSVPSIEGR